MGVLKRPFISKHSEEVPPTVMEREFENAEDITYDENYSNEEVLQEPRQRRFGRREIEPEVDDPKNTTEKAVPSAPPQQTGDKKVRLSADISKTLHRRLKMYSFNTDQTILTIIESWVERHCPK